MLHTVLIDDEVYMRQTLEKLTREKCPNVKLVGSAGSVKEGVETISRHHEDLVAAVDSAET
jgi:YesN/AraC family two-component response regulator